MRPPALQTGSLSQTGAMPDRIDAETRSRVMSRVRSRDTGPEIALRKALWELGVRGWRCSPSTVPGKPDICFRKRRVAIFVDGAFWHGHPSRYWPGRSGPYWDKKIARNQERDRQTNDLLEAQGWTVIRVWDFEIK